MSEIWYKNKLIKTNCMKNLILIILIPFFSFSQLLEVKVQKSEFNIKDGIILNVKNNDTRNRFLNVQ